MYFDLSILHSKQFLAILMKSELGTPHRFTDIKKYFCVSDSHSSNECESLSSTRINICTLKYPYIPETSILTLCKDYTKYSILVSSTIIYINHYAHFCDSFNIFNYHTDDRVGPSCWTKFEKEICIGPKMCLFIEKRNLATIPDCNKLRRELVDFPNLTDSELKELIQFLFTVL